MPPRKTIEKASIIDAAFQIVRESGWEALTARNLAKRLKSSTMPLYSTLKSMDEIRDEIRKKATLIMHEYQRRTYTKEQLLNGAVGYVMFAREEKNLFRFLTIDSGQYQSATGSWPNTELAIPFNRELDISQLIPGVPQEAIRQIIQRGWIFTHGLATLVNSGVIPFDQDEICKLLVDNAVAQSSQILKDFYDKQS